jgi:transposase
VRIRRIIALLALVALPAIAEPRIESLAAISNGSGSVSVRFALADAFRDHHTVQALQSGLPTSFTYVVEIYRDRPRWFDEGIGRSRIEVIATFNSVTREYLLNYRRDRKLVRSETFSSLDALQKRMTTVDEPALFDIGTRRPYKVKVRVKADFGRGFLLYVIPWKISTHWREVRVTAPPEAPPSR